MSSAAPLQFDIRPHSVSISGATFLADASSQKLREFLRRAFTLSETRAVILTPGEAKAEIRFRPRASGEPHPWHRLAKALKSEAPSQSLTLVSKPPINVADLSLDDDIPGAPLRVTRSGNTLSTWRVRQLSPERVRISHPKLNRREVAFRLTSYLAALHGVTSFRRTPSGFVVDIDPQYLTAEQFIGAVERSWPEFLRGQEGPAFPTKLVVTIGLLLAAVTAQFYIPALSPFVLAAVVAYGFPNIVNAARQLRRGEIGLPVLYATGLLFTLLSRNPLSSTIMAVLMQSWPRLGENAAIRAAQTLFLGQRRRLAWARKLVDGVDVEVAPDSLVAGDLITVRSGEYFAVDGTVESGYAAVDEDTLTGVIGAIDKAPGDPVYAATYVRTGSVVVRATRTGASSSAGVIASKLPAGSISNLPSAAQVEFVAARNAKSALAFAAASMFAVRVLRPSQALIRPDYASGPRLSAQLSTLSAIAGALGQGVFVRSHSAIDRLLTTNVYAFDESVELSRKAVSVADLVVAERGAELKILRYATGAFSSRTDERARALVNELERRQVTVPKLAQRRRLAGSIRFEDENGAEIDVATTSFVTRSNIPIPAALVPALADAVKLESGARKDPDLQPLWVLSNNRILGVVRFARTGAAASSIVPALGNRNKRAQFIYLSSAPQREAEKTAREAGIEKAFGDLNAEGKADIIRSAGRRTVWLGDGSVPGNALPLQASEVSISTSGLAHVSADPADVILLRPDLNGVVRLRQLAQTHLSRLRADYRTIYLCNVAGAAGGLLAGFGSLQAGLTSNLGTGLVYSTRWRHLSQLEQSTRAREQARLSSLIEELPPPQLPSFPETDDDVVLDLPAAIFDVPANDGI